MTASEITLYLWPPAHLDLMFFAITKFEQATRCETQFIGRDSDTALNATAILRGSMMEIDIGQEVNILRLANLDVKFEGNFAGIEYV